MTKAPDMNELFRPVRLLGIATEAIDEVGRAREKHGPNADLADGTGPRESILSDAQVTFVDNRRIMAALQQLNDRGMAEGRTHTRLGILLEEAFEAAATDDLVELRAELIQVIAMGLDWVADIDARS